MLKKRNLMTLATLVILCVAIIYFAEYSDIARVEKISVTLYDVLARIDDDNTLNLTASIRVDGFYGKNIRITSQSFLVNDTVLDISQSTQIVSHEQNTTFLVVKSLFLDQKLQSAIENNKYLNIKIAFRGVNENSVSFSGNYERTIKFLYKLPTAKVYYFTIFDFYGING